MKPNATCPKCGNGATRVFVKIYCKACEAPEQHPRRVLPLSPPDDDWQDETTDPYIDDWWVDVYKTPDRSEDKQ